MKLSVIIPARDEAGCIQETLIATVATLRKAGIDFELVVVDDGSSDETAQIAHRVSDALERVIVVPRAEASGFGFAVRTGLESCSGDVIAVMMADGSDNPRDLVSY